MDTNNNNNNKQCECNKAKVVNDLLKRISNLEFDVEDKQRKIESLKQINEEHKKINGELRVENERLNNIINELEKELKEDYKIWICNSRSNGKSVKFGIDVCKTHFYNRLQELKGSE